MTPDSRHNGILLSGYYGCGNLGDDLLLTVAIEELRAILPDARFLVRDHGETASLPDLGPNVSFTGVDAVLRDQSRPRRQRLTAYLRHFAKLLHQCRWLIFGGGTVFHDGGGLGSLTLQWLLCNLARALGVRIAALGVGVGDLRTRRGRWLLRRIVALSDLFLVRDEAALKQCAGSKARLTADLVFAWKAPISADVRPPTSGDRPCVGLTVSPTAGSHALSALVDAVRCWQERGHRVVFLVFQRSAAIVDDVTVFTHINAQLGTQPAIEVRRLAADAKLIAEAFADIDVVCGMRLHGLVLAAMLGRPFVGVAHDNKISEICRSFAMPCLDAASLGGIELATSAETIRQRTPNRSMLDRCIESAEENFRAFASLKR